MGVEIRRSARDLIGALRHALAENPRLSYVHVTAKLKSHGECAADDSDKDLDAERKQILASALCDLARIRPCA